MENLAAHAHAPFFEALDSQGLSFSSNSLKGKPYILFFYPKDDTPGCTKEACEFRDIYPLIIQASANLIGVSPDREASHQKFQQKYSLPFKLLCDEHYLVAQAFGVYQEKNNYGKKSMGIVRSTFLVDADGIIQWSENPVKVEGHTERVLDALNNLTSRT